MRLSLARRIKQFFLPKPEITSKDVLVALRRARTRVERRRPRSCNDMERLRIDRLALIEPVFAESPTDFGSRLLSIDL